MRPPLHLRLAEALLSAVAPRTEIRHKEVHNIITRDPAVWQSALADPLCTYDRVTPRWFRECKQQGPVAIAQAAALGVPVLFLVAGSDLLVDPEAARAAYERVPEPRRWHQYPDAYHEIFQDYGKEDVLRDLWHWLVEQGFARA